MSLFTQSVRSFALWTAAAYILLLLVFLVLKKCGKCTKIPYLRLLVAAYVFGICSQTVFPKMELCIQGDTNLPYLEVYPQGSSQRLANLVPLRTIIGYLTGRDILVSPQDAPGVIAIQLLGNLLLYLPLGLLCPLAWERFRKLPTLLLSAALLACGIEIIQYFTGRVADIDDVLLHVIGALVGYGVWYIWRQQQAKRPA